MRSYVIQNIERVFSACAGSLVEEQNNAKDLLIFEKRLLTILRLMLSLLRTNSVLSSKSWGLEEKKSKI